jgi:stage IV sporulation protein FB
MAIKPSWRAFRWRGVPVNFHWTVLFAVPLLVAFGRSWAGALAALPAYLLLIVAHEIGHAAVTRWRGLPVRGIHVYAMHGICYYEQPYCELDDILIAWGGVGAQALLLAFALAASWLLGFAPYALGSALAPPLGILISANMVIAAINLIPAAPLDGAKAWRILPYGFRWLEEQWQARRPRAARRGPDRLRAARAAAPMAGNTEPMDVDDPQAARVASELLDRLKKKDAAGG